MRNHTKLRAFELADEIAVLIYKITKSFPKEELFGLTSQMRKAAVSIPSNIVEGSARTTQNEYVRFLEIAYGSLKELDYQLSLAKRLDYLPEKSFVDCNLKIEETKKVLCSLIKTLLVK